MFETTTPAKGEKLSDEKVNGSVALLLFDMVVTVSSIQMFGLAVTEYRISRTWNSTRSLCMFASSSHLLPIYWRRGFCGGF